MTGLLIFFAVGVLFFACEIFLPGAVMGILGGLALLAGVGVGFQEFGPTGGLIALAAALGLGGLTLWIELAVLPRTKLARTFSMDATVHGTSQPPPADPARVVGQIGVAETTLAPSGYVLVGGERYVAFCQTGHAAKGCELRVVGTDNFRLIVSHT
jgi:membrane-bound ClpP family serine protease